MPATKKKSVKSVVKRQSGERRGAAEGPQDGREARELARRHSAAAIARLVQLMENEDARISIAACNALLDRGLGKSGQSVDINGKPGTSHEDALAELE